MRLGYTLLNKHRRLIESKIPEIHFDEIADVFDSKGIEINLISLLQLTEDQKNCLRPEYEFISERHSDVWFGWITTIRAVQNGGLKN